MYLCIYCGDLATTRDHVPPTSIKSLNQQTYPACKDCNLYILRDCIPLGTIEERRIYIGEILEKRFINSSDCNWTEEEIEELGVLLKREILIRLEEYKKLSLRITYIKSFKTD